MTQLAMFDTNEVPEEFPKLPAHDKVKCPEAGCDTRLKPGSVRQHLKRVHKITRSQSVIDRQLGQPPSPPKKRGRPFGSKNGTGTRVRPSQAKGLPKGFLAEPLYTVDEVLAVKKQAALTAVEIVRMTAEILWPEGVSHTHVEALLAWYTQTEQFLASLGE